MIQRARHVLMAALVFTMVTSSEAARAQPSSPDRPDRAERSSARATARDLGDRGFAALQRGEWRVAETLFRRAESFYHAPTLLLGLARAEAQLGELVQATEHYQRVIDEDEPPPDTNVAIMLKAIKDAKAEIGPVKARCARVVVVVVGPASLPASALSIDDAEAPRSAPSGERLLNPGAHRFAVRVDGYLPAESSVTLHEGESREVSLTLVREGPVVTEPHAIPAPESSRNEPDARARGGVQRTLGIAALGLGGAAFVTGAVGGILALGARSSLSGSPCPTGCDGAELRAYEDDRSRYRTTTTIATVGFTAGAVFGVAGAILLFTAPRSRSATAATIMPMVMPYADTNGIGAVGRF